MTLQNPREHVACRVLKKKRQYRVYQAHHTGSNGDASRKQGFTQVLKIRLFDVP
jgi:hypothetical protein